MPKYNINWNLTRQCNLRCKHCYYEAGTQLEDELSTAECFAVLDEIAEVFGAGAGAGGEGSVGSAGARVTFGGGEALLREDLFEIISHAKERGLHLVLASNGTLLNEEVAGRLKAAGVEEVIIPIDGTQETHDFIRGEGVFEKAVQGARACRAAGLGLVVDPCIMKQNEAETGRIIEIAADLGARQCRFFHYIPMGRGKERLPADTELGSVQYAENLSLLYEEQNKRRELEICTTQAAQYWVVLKRKAEQGLFVPEFFYNEIPGCRAATGMLSIKPNGDVVPCPLLEVKAGNLRETSLREILNSRVFVALKNREVKGKCAECRHKEICGGCRVRAFLNGDGDYLAEDPLCSEFFFEEM